MQVHYLDLGLERLCGDEAYAEGFREEVVDGFRDCMQLIRAARTPQVLGAFEMLRMERLGNDEYEVRVTNAWKLAVRFKRENNGYVAMVEKLMNRPGDDA